MTDTQAKQIQDFRVQGLGYRTIASVLGLSRDVVRSYCKNNGLGGYSAEAVGNTQQSNACPYCSQTIQQPATGRKRKFCSDTCRRAWWAVHPMDAQKSAFYDRTCVYCGQTFTTYGNKTRRYCSHNCYVHDRFYRDEEFREPYVSPAKGDKQQCHIKPRNLVPAPVAAT